MAFIAGLPLSAYPIASAVQREALPPGAMEPFAAVAEQTAGTPIGDAWVGWLDWCCDHAWIWMLVVGAVFAAVGV